MARENCSEINVALLVWSEATWDWGRIPVLIITWKKKTDPNIVLIVLASPMKCHKCPIKNQHACWLNLDKKTKFCPPLALVAGGSLTPRLLASAANAWSRLMRHGGTPKSSMDFLAPWNWWHLVGFGGIWVNFGINHHDSAIIHHYYGDFTIIHHYYGDSPLFSHEVGWPQVGFFSPWGVRPFLSITVFDAPEMDFFFNGLHIWLHIWLHMMEMTFFFWEPTLTLEDEILKKCVGFCHKRVFNTIWPTWHMGYSADQAKSVKKSRLILIPDVFPLPPRTIASVRRVRVLLVLLLTPNARLLDQWLGRISARAADQLWWWESSSQRSSKTIPSSWVRKQGLVTVPWLGNIGHHQKS